MTKSKEDILRLIDDADVHYIRLNFTDILGRLKGMSITRSEIETILERGQGFDGSSIEGFVRIEESDLMAIPDFRTFRIIPWDIGGERTAMMFCDIQNHDGTPYDGDPRWVLKRTLEKLAQKGWTAYLGPELEFFYFKDEMTPEAIDQSGYFDYESFDLGTQVVKKTVTALELMGIPVECSHHEVAPSQQEIDLKYQEALIMADFAQIYKFVVKEVAAENEIYATFMPKPIFGENGSGMHTHMSLFKGDTNLFYDKDNEYQLTELARHFMAGILTHVKEITMVLNQWVNSYKRLVVGYEAPVYVSWGRRNRSSLVRVPMFKAGHEKSTRIELRSPDPACNPYLAFALMLSAGLQGIEKKYPLPSPIEENIFEMSTEKRAKLKIDSLPDSLENAIRETEKSKLVRETLGNHIFDTLIANKKVEWDEYRVNVTNHEINKYLSFL
ncbi:putative glutamine synthetase 2 [Candidatus Zixiibacteriota bacterium]|nr:putative glutamine synthetase 2 [candidate division Zixibacteria bacterium]